MDYKNTNQKEFESELHGLEFEIRESNLGGLYGSFLWTKCSGKLIKEQDK